MKLHRFHNEEIGIQRNNSLFPYWEILSENRRFRIMELCEDEHREFSVETPQSQCDLLANVMKYASNMKH